MELERGAAADTLKTILRFNDSVDTGAQQEATTAKPEWWGDSIWKTTRNAEQWKNPQPAPAEGKK